MTAPTSTRAAKPWRPPPATTPRSRGNPGRAGWPPRHRAGRDAAGVRRPAWSRRRPGLDGAGLGSSRSRAAARGQALALPPGPAWHRGAEAGAGATRRRARARARHARVALGHRWQRIEGRVDRVRGGLRGGRALLGDPQRHRGHSRGGGRRGHEEAPGTRADEPARLPEAPVGRHRSGARRSPGRRGPGASHRAGDVAPRSIRSLAASLRAGRVRRQRAPPRRRTARPGRTGSNARSACSTSPNSPGGSWTPRISRATPSICSRRARAVWSSPTRSRPSARWPSSMPWWSER